MGKKILVPGLDVIMIAFFAEKYTVKDHISNTKLEKGVFLLHLNLNLLLGINLIN